ncbi:MAG TPA: transporter, partial [Gammaproteobacteria bacterium]|nr:transporter [Gammaproteobacteria bacterium]
MIEEIGLEKLLAFLQPKLLKDEYVFFSSDTMSFSDILDLEPVATYREEEGLSLILTKVAAMQAG